MTDKTYPGEKWLLGLVFLLGGLVYHELLFWNLDSISRTSITGMFFSLSGASPHYHYLLAAGLLYIRRDDVARACRGKGTPWQAMFYLVPGAVLLLWGHYVSATDLVYISFLLVVLGSARFLAGKHLVRIILLPVLILAMAVPLPAVLINWIVFPLQLWTAEHSAWLLNAIGMQASAVGDVIYLAGKEVRVAESCTALGFIKWLTIYALSYAYLFPASRLHSFLLILSAPFIAYGVNLLRAFSLVLNPGLEVLTIHTIQGILFFLIGFTLLYAVDNFLLRYIGKGGEQTRARAACMEDETAPPGRPRRLATLAAILSTLLLATIFLPRWIPPVPVSDPKFTLAGDVGGWKPAEEPVMKHLFLGSVRYSTHLYRYYTRNNAYVVLFLGYDDRRNRDRSLLSEKNAYQGDIGAMEERSVITPDAPDGRRIVSIDYGSDGDRILAWHWYEGVASLPEEILRAFLALDQSPFRRTEGAIVVRLATIIFPGKDGRAQANGRLRDFLESMGEIRDKITEPD